MGQPPSISRKEASTYSPQEPYKLGFENVNWNYFEAGHGKGAPDGVGGALKRSADRAIKHGEDIPNAQILYEKLKCTNSSVKLFYIHTYISEDDVESKPEVRKEPKCTPYFFQLPTYIHVLIHIC